MKIIWYVQSFRRYRDLLWIFIFKAFSLLKNLSPNGLVRRIYSSKLVSITISLLINATSFYWYTQEVLFCYFSVTLERLNFQNLICVWSFFITKNIKRHKWFTMILDICSYSLEQCFYGFTFMENNSYTYNWGYNYLL